MPGMHVTARREIIEKHLKAKTKDSRAETVRVPWKTGHEVCPVIEVPIDVVLLNRRSHRIAADLEGNPDKEAIEKNPDSEEAQQILAALLRSTANYGDLKANLGELGQQDPGVMTREGILVNANTRAVALKDLGVRYIRVGVLPPGATEQEIAELELRLQMKRDFKQDYTFTNQLLFVDDLRGRFGYDAKGVALMLGYARSSDQADLESGSAEVEQATRLLAIVREVQQVSGNGIKLRFFDDKRQALIEIDQEYEKLKIKDTTAALRLRNTRLIGLLAELGYRELRHVDAQFFEEYLVPTLEDTLLKDEVAALLAPARISGKHAANLNLDALDTDPEDTDGSRGDPRTLLQWFAQSQGKTKIELTAPRKSAVRIQIGRDSLIDAMRGAVDQAVTEARTDRRKEDKLTYPGRILLEVVRKLERATEAYRGIRRDQAFDAKKFRYRLNKVDKGLKILRDEVDKDSQRS